MPLKTHARSASRNADYARALALFSISQDIPFAAAEGDSSPTQHSSRTPARQLLYELLELALGRDPISGLSRLRRREGAPAAVAAGGVQRHTVLDFFDGLFPEEVRHCMMVPWVSDVEARWRHAPLYSLLSTLYSTLGARIPTSKASPSTR